MDFFNSVKEVITQKPLNLKKPHFYKPESDAKNQLKQLKEFYKTAPNNVKSLVEQDIKMLTYGIFGEDTVAFELNNSYIPIIILHDLNIKYEGLSAQIDYLIITTKFTLIVECKNLIGNLEVNSNGDFIRTIQYNGRYKKEGIYSPITQNTRHLEMIKKVRLSSKNNILSKTLFGKYFNENYKSIVILANPKTVINMKYAKKEVKEQIIRSDQLISHTKKLINESTNLVNNEKEMYKMADFFLGLHIPNTTDYIKKYLIQGNETKKNVPVQPIINIEDTPLYKDLRQYRYAISKAEGLKPYFIYNNVQMGKLISDMPRTIDDIKKISGFGDIKCQKYGNAILEIIKKHN